MTDTMIPPTTDTPADWTKEPVQRWLIAAGVLSLVLLVVGVVSDAPEDQTSAPGPSYSYVTD